VQKLMGWRRTSTVLTTVGLALALAAPAAAAKSVTAYSCEEYLVAVTSGGTTTIEDGAIHIRGWSAEYEIFGDPLCAGTLTATISLNLDLSDWSGTVYGTSTLWLDAFDGGFTGSVVAHFTAPDPFRPDAEDIWLGRYVRHGFGELAGWQARGTLLEKHHWLITESGYAFRPGE